MVSAREIDLLAIIVQRAPILKTELMFVNDLMNRLRAMAVEREQLLALKETDKAQDSP